MQIGKTFHAKNREDWRDWLSKHYQTENDIWLLLWRKRSGMPGLTYDEAVEEALCFGWIDSQNKGYDELHVAQRFSPRKSKGPYAPSNIARLKKLVAENKVLPEVLAKLPDEVKP